ncbi:hypothetical protein WMY93_024267 [Mugilogobius chulae]|uniref:FRAS1-related extracellular matrix protein N-terminal domain-containing protein n=1 Tax=Mugilogobius chulae TaxID=88201 RepID=A0AAW0N3N4_9GOBI
MSFSTFIHEAKEKFGIPSETSVYLMDESGTEVDEEVFSDIVEENPDMMWTIVGEHSVTESPVQSFGTDTGSVTSSDSGESFTSPKRQRFNESTLEAKELVKDVLESKAGGEKILKTYQETREIPDQLRRKLVNIVVTNMVEKHGNAPPMDIRTKYAMGIVALFPSLRDPYSEKGYEHFFDASSNEGYIAWKLKNLQRELRLDRRSSSSSSSDKQKGPEVERMVSTTQQLEGDQCLEAISLLKHSTDEDQIFMKMKQTFQYRQKLIHDPDTSNTVFAVFPRFLDTKGLVLQDFQLLFGEETAAKLLEKWAISLKAKIMKEAKNLSKTPTLEVLIQAAEGRPEEDVSSWDSDMASLLLLVYLLPPPPSGKKRPVKISVLEAVNHVIKFHKSCRSLQEAVSSGTGRQPFILAVGTSKANIHDYYIVLDESQIQHVLSGAQFLAVLSVSELLQCLAKPLEVRTLEVFRGRSAFITSSHLNIGVAPGSDCKVEVVLNEPISMRVGGVTPQVFDCSFMEDEVAYDHSGSPLLQEDSVQIRVYWFSSSQTQIQTVVLPVLILDPPSPLVSLGPNPLVVPSFLGLSNPIDASVLQIRTGPDQICSVRFYSSLLPAVGQLVENKSSRNNQSNHQSNQTDCSGNSPCQDQTPPVVFLKTSCEGFLQFGFRYQHLSPPSPQTDHILLDVELERPQQPHTDGGAGLTPAFTPRQDLESETSETYSDNTATQVTAQKQDQSAFSPLTHFSRSESVWIPVRINPGLPDQPPRASFMASSILEVDQFVLTPVTVATLDAEDAETPQSRLVFNVTSPPAGGYLTHLDDHTREIHSFTWDDLNLLKIAYQPPHTGQSQRRNDQMEFQVIDGSFQTSAPIVVHISIRASETNAPRVSWNMGLVLLEGQSRPITWEQLQIVDKDNVEQVFVVAVDGPQHGTLTVKGVTPTVRVDGHDQPDQSQRSSSLEQRWRLSQARCAEVKGPGEQIE